VTGRAAAFADRLGPARLRAVRHALTIVGLISLPYIIFINRERSLFGFDAHAYWAIDLSNLYGASTSNTSDLDAFRYTPAAGQAFAIFHVLPWEVFFGLWFVAMVAALIWLTGRWWPLLLAFPPVPLELYHGNIHLFMAVAIVLGFRYPVAWAFILLTKVSPGVGVLWFAFRGEWRKLAVALIATVAIAAVSVVIAPDLWRQYVTTMVNNLVYDPGHAYPVPIPLPIRLAISAAIVWWGARTDRRWTVPVAATISLPIIWFHGFALLVAAIPLWREDRAHRQMAVGRFPIADATRTMTRPVRSAGDPPR
jgi:glycosyl transferase family 87